MMYDLISTCGTYYSRSTIAFARKNAPLLWFLRKNRTSHCAYVHVRTNTLNVFTTIYCFLAHQKPVLDTCVNLNFSIELKFTLYDKLMLQNLHS